MIVEESAVSFRPGLGRGCDKVNITLKGLGRVSASLSMKYLSARINGHLWSWRKGVSMHSRWLIQRAHYLSRSVGHLGIYWSQSIPEI